MQLTITTSQLLKTVIKFSFNKNFIALRIRNIALKKILKVQSDAKFNSRKHSWDIFLNTQLAKCDGVK